MGWDEMGGRFVPCFVVSRSVACFSFEEEMDACFIRMSGSKTTVRRYFASKTTSTLHCWSAGMYFSPQPLKRVSCFQPSSAKPVHHICHPTLIEATRLKTLNTTDRLSSRGFVDLDLPGTGHWNL